MKNIELTPTGQKETANQQPAAAVEEAARSSEAENWFQSIVSNLRARFDRSEAAEFKRGILGRDYSRKAWVDLALRNIEKAFADGILDEEERDSIIEAVNKKAEAQQRNDKYS